VKKLFLIIAFSFLGANAYAGAEGHGAGIVTCPSKKPELYDFVEGRASVAVDGFGLTIVPDDTTSTDDQIENALQKLTGAFPELGAITRENYHLALKE